MNRIMVGQNLDGKRRGICPNCGKEMEYHDDFYEGFDGREYYQNDYGYYTCDFCGFDTIQREPEILDIDYWEHVFVGA